jgi:hypothetical protein
VNDFAGLYAVLLRYILFFSENERKLCQKYFKDFFIASTKTDIAKRGGITKLAKC